MAVSPAKIAEAFEHGSVGKLTAGVMCYNVLILCPQMVPEPSESTKADNPGCSINDADQKRF